MTLVEIYDKFKKRHPVRSREHALKIMAGIDNADDAADAQPAWFKLIDDDGLFLESFNKPAQKQ